MEKQLSIQQLFDWHINHSFVTLEQEFESFKEVVLEAIAEQNEQVLIYALGNYSEQFVIHADEYQLLQFLYEIERDIAQNFPNMLAVLYLVIGHCYFIQLNLDIAKGYYKKATSIAFEYGMYPVLSITSNNMTDIYIDKMPQALAFELSKMPAIFFLIKGSEQNPVFVQRMLIHFSMAIRTNRLDYAAQIYDRFFAQAQVEENSRFAYQIQKQKADLLDATNQQHEAAEMYHDILMQCIKSNKQRDIIEHCYQKLSRYYESIFEEQLSKSFEDTRANFLNEERSKSKILESYFKRNSKDHISSKPQAVKAFEQLAEQLLQDTTGQGHTLVVVELKTNPLSTQLAASVITMMQQEMQTAFAEKIILHEQLTDVSVSYVVALSEEAFDEQVKTVFNKIRQHYPKDTAELEAIYFASVNNKDNQLIGYEKCLELAYAYIYYELYK